MYIFNILKINKLLNKNQNINFKEFFWKLHVVLEVIYFSKRTKIIQINISKKLFSYF